ncbi:hypothetical protein LTR17_011084 [Elasticomyces elasticus]|nr:hypothetical protein LTR17_011084 [Elasticomyces elasticus]
MPDSPPKRATIPSWQHTAKPVPEDNDNTLPPPASDDAEAEVEETPPPDSTTAQLDMVEAFLTDPSIQNQPIEKKKAFLQTKNIPVETIEQVLKPAHQTQTTTTTTPANPPVFEASDFSSFRSQQSQPPPPAVQQEEKMPDRPPPVITYPEFLVDAHVPPPLLTPARVLTAAYIASGIAALCYGASRFLLGPMSDSLTDARREFAGHSREKLEEFNERLGGIVSKLPSPPAGRGGEKEGKGEEGEGDEEESEAEDPTELYHRDTGTQTSLPPSPVPQAANPFLPANLAVTEHVKKTPEQYQTGGLELLRTHLSSLSVSTGSHSRVLGDAKKGVDELRHVLDTLQYGGDRGYDYYDDATTTGDFTVQSKDVGGKDAVEKWAKVEGLKKEIRGVKGVLLSARRFPGVGVGGR